MASPARRADIAFAVTVGLCLLALLASGVIGKRLEMIGHDDFSRIWAGPRAVLLGHCGPAFHRRQVEADHRLGGAHGRSRRPA